MTDHVVYVFLHSLRIFSIFFIHSLLWECIIHMYLFQERHEVVSFHFTNASYIYIYTYLFVGWFANKVEYQHHVWLHIPIMVDRVTKAFYGILGVTLQSWIQVSKWVRSEISWRHTTYFQVLSGYQYSILSKNLILVPERQCVSLWYSILRTQSFQVNEAKWSHMKTQFWVNISSVNDFLPEGTKPLLELMLTSHQWRSVSFIWERFYSKRVSSYVVWWIWKFSKGPRSGRVHSWF